MYALDLRIRPIRAGADVTLLLMKSTI